MWVTDESDCMRDRLHKSSRRVHYFLNYYQLLLERMEIGIKVKFFYFRQN